MVIKIHLSLSLIRNSSFGILTRTMKTLLILFGLLAILSVAYTLSDDEKNEDGEVQAIMEELTRGVVAQMQEDEDQQSSAGLQSAMRELLAEVQEDEDSKDNGAREQQEGDGGDILALLQEDDDDNGGAVQAEDEEGGEAQVQGRLTNFFRTIRRFGDKINGICRTVTTYTRYLRCLPTMEAEMQTEEDGDEKLATDLLKRIANLQEDSDGDAEAQLFGRVFRRARRFTRRLFKRGRRIYHHGRRLFNRGRRFVSKVRRGIGRLYRGYKKISSCVKRIG